MSDVIDPCSCMRKDGEQAVIIRSVHATHGFIDLHDFFPSASK